MQAIQLTQRGASTLPVIEGALAFVVITLIGQTWGFIPENKHHLAFAVIYGAGAHFIFSFLAAVPFLYIGSRLKSAAINFGFIVAMFVYVFWSLNEQHKGLAMLLSTSSWRIPLPFGECVYQMLRSSLRTDESAYYFGPLFLSYTTAIILCAPVATLNALASLFRGNSARR